MKSAREISERDIELLAGIVQGPGHYPTPSPERVQRLIDKGLVRKIRGRLRPTLKGRIVAWLKR